ncbi:MAG TPA: phosphodiester glycosidase family protein [Candidatus Binatia bacterium]|nr:phosphodiester glycosidase family protein [Candidatus Binatia bacterium]
MRLRRHISALVRVLLTLIVLVYPAAAQEPRASPWTALAPGLWYRRWAVDVEEDSAIEGHVFRADPRILHVTVIDARRADRRTAPVATMRREAQAYVVVNGGFFDEKAEPLGLVVGDGKQTSPLRKVDQGVFLISLGRPIIQHTRDPLPDPIDTALQSGPRLVVAGRVVQLKPQSSRRTSVCLPGDGTVMIVVFTVPISLPDLATNLARPASDGGLGCWSALNLDGGPSTQLSVAAPSLTLEVEGGWGVPNGLAILPRSTTPPAPPP